MSYQTIIVEKKEHLGWITLNRPEAKNTFTIPLAQELNAALRDLDDDAGVRVIVVRAAGRHFSVGIDLGEFKGKSHKEYRDMLTWMDMHNHTIPRMKKPVIASVQGYVVANGAGLALACDLTVAAESAQFGTTAINVGLICLGPASPLVRALGRKKALELILTGEMIPAAEAARLGLINRVVPDDQLEAATLDLATKLAAKSPLALQAGKQGLYALADLPYHQGIDYMGELFAALCATTDGQEGVAAFLAKRPPVWQEK